MRFTCEKLLVALRERDLVRSLGNDQHLGQDVRDLLRDRSVVRARPLAKAVIQGVREALDVEGRHDSSVLAAFWRKFSSIAASQRLSEAVAERVARSPRLPDLLGSGRGKGLARPHGDAPAGARESPAARPRRKPESVPGRAVFAPAGICLSEVRISAVSKRPLDLPIRLGRRFRP